MSKNRNEDQKNTARSDVFSASAIGINKYVNPGMDKYGSHMTSSEIKKAEKETGSVFMSKKEHQQELSRIQSRKNQEEKKREAECFDKINRDIYRVFDR